MADGETLTAGTQPEGPFPINGENRPTFGRPAAPPATSAPPPDASFDPSTLTEETATEADGGGAGGPAEVGPYRVAEFLAAGGMGAVYRAVDTAIGRDVAVKVLADHLRGSAWAVGRFLDEARIAGRLQHPGIPPVFAVGHQVDGAPYLAMKLIRGRTLAAALAAGPAPDRGRLVDAFEQICQAVGYAHSKGVIHRDLKPANVMIGAFGEVQVMDWGLARVLAAAGDEAAGPGASEDEDAVADPRADSGGQRTQAGRAMGTPAYMPPEQAVGAAGRIDRRSDVFGLGGVLCAVLAGRPPFQGGTPEQTLALAAAGEVGAAFAALDGAGADPDLVALCKRCLAPDPADRPADAGEVAAAVAAHRAGVDDRLRRAEAERAAAEAREAEQRKRRRVQAALAAAVLLLVAGGGGGAWWAAGQRAERAAAELRRESAERERLGRNAQAAASLLGQAEDALRAGDADRAALPVEQAEARAADGGGDAARLARCREDLAVLRELDRVDQFRWSPADNRWPSPRAVAERWRRAFDRFGLRPGAAAGDAAARLAGSPIRDRLLAGLYLWLVADPAADLLGVLAAADPDGHRAAVRGAIRAGDAGRLTALAAEGGDQPAWFAAALGECQGVPAGLRRRTLERALGHRPGDLGLLMALGWSYPVNERAGAGERVRWYQAAVSAHPGNPYAVNHLGQALLDAGDPAGAAEAFRRAVALAPGLAMARANLGRAARAAGDPGAAVGHLREAVRLDPSLGWAHAELGFALRAAGDPRAAAAALREAVRLEPDFGWAQGELAKALREAGDPAGAVGPLREVLRLDPTVGWAHAELGLALRAAGDPRAAVAALREAIRLEPGLAWIWAGLGQAAHDAGDPRAAVAAYREAIRLDPGQAWAHAGLGYALLDGDPAAAAAGFREAVRLDPKSAWAFAGLGAALRSADPAGAVAAYRHAVRLAPQDAKARLDLAWLLATSPDPAARDGAEAVATATAACGLTNWADPEGLRVLAAAHAEAGDFGKAVAFQRRSVDPAFHRDGVTDRFADRLALYERRLPYRTPEPAPPPRPAR